MKYLACLFAVCLIVLMGGCVTRPATRVGLVEWAPGKQAVGIGLWKWEGFGPDGYEGYRAWSYWLKLAGDGPVYINPRVEGGAGEPCIGSVTLDREHNLVTINLRRIVSQPGRPERTKPHPANGTYKIDEIRKAGIDDKW